MRDDRGAAVVEMALVLPILALFVFGIISFGYLMSFRQNMTEAAQEGARAAAVAAPANQGSDATSAMNAAIQQSFGHPCGSAGLTCANPVIAPCPNDAAHQCATVTLTYDYKNYPLLPDPPLVSIFLPSTLTQTATARVS